MKASSVASFTECDTTVSTFSLPRDCWCEQVSVPSEQVTDCYLSFTHEPVKVTCHLSALGPKEHQIKTTRIKVLIQTACIVDCNSGAYRQFSRSMRERCPRQDARSSGEEPTLQSGWTCMQLLFVAVFVYTATLSKGFGKNNVYQDSFQRVHYSGKFNATRTKTTEGMGTTRCLQSKTAEVVGKMPGERFKRMLRANRLLGNL